MSTPHLYPPPAAAVKGAHVSGIEAYNKLVAEADADYEGYWARLAREFVSWKTPFTKVLNGSGAPFFKWFEDGTLNVSYNCLDRQVSAGLGSKTAIIDVGPMMARRDSPQLSDTERAAGLKVPDPQRNYQILYLNENRE